jgi:hypothetical protein
MNRNRPVSIHRAVSIVILCLTLFPAIVHGASSKATQMRRGFVWILFVSSEDCPRCDGVKKFVSVLKQKYPVRTKRLDIGRDRDRSLLGRLEAIHAEKKFAVPLIMVGDSILIGESEISEKLEATVKRLARKGGSPLPYLGPTAKDKKTRTEGRVAGAAAEPPSQPERASSECPTCEKRPRPPSFSEELGRIKGLLNKLF